MPVIQLKRLRVKCDRCDWFEIIDISHPEDVRKWHNVSCPECGDSIIISDEDLKAFESLLGLIKVAARTPEDSQPVSDEKRKQVSVAVTIDTAGLR